MKRYLLLLALSMVFLCAHATAEEEIIPPPSLSKEPDVAATEDVADENGEEAEGEEEEVKEYLPTTEHTDWIYDESSGLLWSETAKLFFDQKSGHYYDPDSDQWYNSHTEEWYRNEQAQEE